MLKLLADIFLSFFKIGLFTLGGGLAIISLVQQEMVGRGWLTNAQFMDILGIAQMTPGPIGVNTATFVGYRVAETQGHALWAAVLVSLFATLSVTLPSVIGVHFGGGWFERHRGSQWVRRVFAVLRPLVAGFVTAAGATLALECFGADVDEAHFVVVMQAAQSRQVAELLANLLEALEEHFARNLRKPVRTQEPGDGAHVACHPLVFVVVAAMIAMRVNEAERVPASREVEIDALDGGRLLSKVEQVDAAARNDSLVHEPTWLAEVRVLGTLADLGERNWRE